MQAADPVRATATIQAVTGGQGVPARAVQVIRQDRATAIIPQAAVSREGQAAVPALAEAVSLPEGLHVAAVSAAQAAVLPEAEADAAQDAGDTMAALPPLYHPLSYPLFQQMTETAPGEGILTRRQYYKLSQPKID